MKIVIDIPEEEYNQIKEWEDNITGYQTSLVLYRAVRNSIPYEERPKGKWVKITKDGVMPIEYICNICGRTIKSYYEEYFIEKVYPFCNCGVDMREGDTK